MQQKGRCFEIGNFARKYYHCSLQTGERAYGYNTKGLLRRDKYYKRCKNWSRKGLKKHNKKRLNAPKS